MHELSKVKCSRYVTENEKWIRFEVRPARMMHTVLQGGQLTVVIGLIFNHQDGSIRSYDGTHCLHSTSLGMQLRMWPCHVKMNENQQFIMLSSDL